MGHQTAAISASPYWESEPEPPKPSNPRRLSADAEEFTPARPDPQPRYYNPYHYDARGRVVTAEPRWLPTPMHPWYGTVCFLKLEGKKPRWRAQAIRMNISR